MAVNLDDREEIRALYPPDVDVDSLMESLVDAGVSDDQMAVLTPLPLAQRASAHLGAVPFYVVAIIAGLVGIAVGIFFAGGTAAMYPLMTGGKPIVAAPIVGIISYETMMLLAIVVTFVAMIVGIKRSHRSISRRDARIDDGYMMVAVSVPADSSQEVQVRALLQRAEPLEVHVTRAASVPASSEEGTSGRAVAIGLAAVCFVSTSAACSRDMQDQPSYQSQEAPRLHSPIGSVPRDSRSVLQPLPAQEVVGEGARLFRINCSHCHGMDGTGKSPVTIYLKEKPANLHRPEVQELSESALHDTVTNGLAVEGRDVMPPFKGELSAEERRSVAAYVKSLSQP